MFMDKVKSILAFVVTVLTVAAGISVWRYAAAADKAEPPREERRTRDVPKAKVVPAARRKFHIHLSITRIEGGRHKLLSAPSLVTLEGTEASFAEGSELLADIGSGEMETVFIGRKVHCVVRSVEDGKVRLDMTVLTTQRGTFGGNEVTVESKSLRALRSIKLGELVTAKIKTGEDNQNILEVTAIVRDGQSDPREKSNPNAESELAMADYFERMGHPETAHYYYQSVCTAHPDTPYAERAKKRIAELKKKQEKPTTYHFGSNTRGLTLVEMNKQREQRAAAEEKPPSRVGQIFIVGNVKTKQEVILKQVKLYPGQILTYPDIQTVERDLARLKGFKSPPKITIIEREDGGEFKDIRITVEEK